LRPRRFGSLNKVPLSVRYSSEFSNTLPFVYAVEDPSGKLAIDRLNLSAADPKKTMVDVEIQVSFYTSGDPMPVSTSTKRTTKSSTISSQTPQ